MTSHRACAVVVAVCSIVLAGSSAPANELCCSEGVQESGSIYRICMPPMEDYNGRLVIWAHGFQDAGTPVQIPEDQLVIGDTSLPELMTGLGFAFATNSYSKTGLAVRQGMDDILDLVTIFDCQHGTPERVYLTGASEGGVITALLAEESPWVFDGGVAACGPVGDFTYQIGYFGDARATFEFFFPALISGEPFDPPAELAENWYEYYESSVKPVILDPANRQKLEEWVRVAKLPFDPDNWLETVETSAAAVLRYAVVNLRDAAETLGGFPYDNYGKIYLGSSSDLLLNLFVPRVAADVPALHELEDRYTTSGALEIPLITLHTRKDEQVPYFHEVIYTLKNLRAGSWLKHRLNIPIKRYGHCNFTENEAIFSFAVMLVYAGDFDVLEDIIDRLQPQQVKIVQRLIMEREAVD